MDGTTYHWELGETGAELHPSARALAEAQGRCLDECGIVEVEVRPVRVLWSGERAAGRGDARDGEAVRSALAASLRARIAGLQRRLAEVEAGTGIGRISERRRA